MKPVALLKFYLFPSSAAPPQIEAVQLFDCMEDAELYMRLKYPNTPGIKHVGAEWQMHWEIAATLCVCAVEKQEGDIV